MPSATASKNSSRLQVEVTSQQLSHVQSLMTVCGLRTQKELINNALTLFEWAVEEVQKGNDVGSFNKGRNTYEVLRMPVLINAARHGKENIKLTPAELEERKVSNSVKDNADYDRFSVPATRQAI